MQYITLLGVNMRIPTKKMTYEDKFDRTWRCNPERFMKKVKKANRKKMRRELKNVV